MHLSVLPDCSHVAWTLFLSCSELLQWLPMTFKIYCSCLAWFTKPSWPCPGCLPLWPPAPAFTASGLPAQPQCPAIPAFTGKLLFILQNPDPMLSPQERLPGSLWMERIIISCSLFSFRECPENPLWQWIPWEYKLCEGGYFCFIHCCVLRV